MNKETANTMQPENASSQELVDQIGKTNLDDIIEALGLPKRDVYAGEELQEILGVHAKMKELKTQNVSKGVSAYLESLDGETKETQTKNTKPAAKGKQTKKKKTTTQTPSGGKGKIAAKPKEVQGDLQQKFVTGKKLELQQTVAAGSDEGTQLARAYRFGKQTAFLKTSIENTVSDAQVIREQLGNVHAAVYNNLELPEDYLEGIEMPEVPNLFAELEGRSENGENELGAGLGFTGILGELTNGNLTDEVKTLLSGEKTDQELEEEEEEEEETSLPLLRLLDEPQETDTVA